MGPYSVGGPVVNGGLIDFQDGTLRAGYPSSSPAEYLSPQHLLAVQQQQTAGGIYAIVPQPQQQAQPQTVPVGAGQTLTPYPVPNVAQPAVLSGPPSYIHVNGVTYKPVAEPPATEQQAATAQDPSSSNGSASSVMQSSQQRPLTEDELHKAIDRRVSVVAEDYISRKLHRRSFSREHGDGGASSGPGSMVARHRSAPVVTHSNGHGGGNFPRARSYEARPSRPTQPMASTISSAADLEAALRRVKSAVASLPPTTQPAAPVSAHRRW